MNQSLSRSLITHFLDILLEREIAEPPDFMDIDPLEDIISTELGALL
jgi:hypothetical protein